MSTDPQPAAPAHSRRTRRAEPITKPAAHVALRTGRPTQLTDEFLRDVTRSARQAWRGRHPINDYVAAAMLAAGKTRYHANDETVRGWRKAAVRRRQQSQADDSSLLSRELRGKPPKTNRPNNTEDDR